MSKNILKLLIFLAFLILLSSCNLNNETEKPVIYKTCSELPANTCHETEICKDNGGYPVCDCKNEDEIWIENSCKKPELIQNELKPFDASKKIHLFSAIDRTAPENRYLHIFDTENRELIQSYVHYKHGVDDPILKSKLTGKYYFYDKTNYYDYHSPVDYGNGGLVEIDHETGKFKEVYVDNGTGRLYDITDKGELIIVGGNSCKTSEDFFGVGTEGKIYNPKTKTYRSFCLPGEVKTVQYNENGNIYAYVIGFIEDKGDRAKIYEVNCDTLKLKFLADFRYINFISFNQKDKLYVYDLSPIINKLKVIDLTDGLHINTLNSLKDKIGEALENDEFGVDIGYIVNNIMYMNVFGRNLDPYVLMKCNLENNECEMLHQAANTYLFGYLKDSNMLAWGWEERSFLLDLKTEDFIGPLGGHTFPKGWGL